MKNCVFCRVEITVDDNVIERSVSSGDEICKKCHKNELKYGKPQICKYCLLTAAFVDGKCVHCSYSERKHGHPLVCHNCKLNAAFPKDATCKNKKLLCRLCKLSYKRGMAKAENSRKRVDEANRYYSGQVLKKLKGASSESVDSFGDQILAVTQLKDQVGSLRRQLSQKDQALLERDKKIASLNAQNLQLIKEHRQKIQQLQREHQDIQESLQERIRVLSRQNASLSKGKKLLQNDVTSASPSMAL